jgi:Carboxylesterase family
MKNSEKANKRLDHCGISSRLMFGAAAICVFTLIPVATASADNSSHRPIAFTESGLVIGSMTDGGNEFLGIPYAAPPVGALRWRPPKRYGFFPGFALQATQFGSACTQPGGIGSENCLFLNVYTPQTESGDSKGHGLPVMFWIHGGGLINGSSTPYNPERFVKKGVIVVTINYRLGYLGFFAHSAIDAEGHLNSNYGLMDQQFALGVGSQEHREFWRRSGSSNNIRRVGRRTKRLCPARIPPGIRHVPWSDIGKRILCGIPRLLYEHCYAGGGGNAGYHSRAVRCRHCR